MPIKAALFDLDNTLIDFMGMKRACCSAAVEAMIRSGLGMEKGKALRLLFGLYKKHGIEYQHIFEAFTKKLGGKVDYRLVAEGIIAYRKAQLVYMKPYADVVPTLLRLREKGLKLGIVTDAPAIKAWMRLVETGLSELFDVVITFDDTREKKPSSRPFLKALKALKLKPEEALFVGDWPERDIKGAKALGMKTAFAAYGSEHRGGRADYVLRSFREVLRAVGR